MAYYYNEEYLNKYVGNGLSTTKTFDRLTLRTNSITGIEKIQDSIFNILSTRVGERVLMPEFGSRLYLVLFEQNTPIFADLAKFYITDALSKWEKRIELDGIKVSTETEGNIVPIEISYHISGSNIRETYVYPFKVDRFGDPDMYKQGSVSLTPYETAVH